MLTHTHVYYSNRFEAGTLFPDTFKIDRGAQLAVLPVSIIHVEDLDTNINFSDQGNSVRILKSIDTAYPVDFIAFQGNIAVVSIATIDVPKAFVNTGSTVFTSKLEVLLEAASSMSATLMYILVPSSDFNLDKAFSVVSNGTSYSALDKSFETLGYMEDLGATFTTYTVSEDILPISLTTINLNVNSMIDSQATVTII